MGVIGLEEELILATPGLRDVAKRRQLAALTVGCVKEVVCAVRCVEGANSPLGFMVENGGRIYIDGEFIESATPEVLTPL